MKLTEAILFESYGDLKRVLSEELGKADRSSHQWQMKVEFLSTVYYSTRNSIPDTPKVSLGKAEGLTELIRWVAKHPKLSSEDREFRDVGNWIRQARNFGIISVFTTLQNALASIRDKHNSADNQKPDIDIIKKTSKYQVFRLNNFAAARKVCNTFNTNFCIGSGGGSGASWFKTYGEDKDAETFAISFFNRKVIIAHVGRTHFMFTDHTNEHQYSDASVRGLGRMGIVNQIIGADLDLDDMTEMLNVVLKDFSYKNRIINDMSKLYMELTMDIPDELFFGDDV